MPGHSVSGRCKGFGLKSTSSSDVLGVAPFESRYCTMSVFPLETAACRSDLSCEAQHISMPLELRQIF